MHDTGGKNATPRDPSPFKWAIAVNLLTFELLRYGSRPPAERPLAVVVSGRPRGHCRKASTREPKQRSSATRPGLASMKSSRAANYLAMNGFDDHFICDRHVDPLPRLELIQIFDPLAQLQCPLLPLRIFKRQAALLWVNRHDLSADLCCVYLHQGRFVAFR